MYIAHKQICAFQISLQFPVKHPESGFIMIPDESILRTKNILNYESINVVMIQYQ